MKSRGQTALEYLLIVAVGIMVVIAVMVWLQGASKEIGDVAKEQTDPYICGTTKCSTDDHCKISACGNNGTCDNAKNHSSFLCQVP